MNVNEFNMSKFLNAKSAGELNDGKPRVIYAARAETVQDKRKLILELEGVEKTLIVNKTNREILAEAYGDETDAWRGKQVLVTIAQVMFEGKRTPSIVLQPHDGDPVGQQPVETAPADAEHPPAKGRKAR